MTDQRQAFDELLCTTITDFRATRGGSLRQRKLHGLVTEWHRTRLLNLQAAYMMITRAAPRHSTRPDLHAVKTCLVSTPLRSRTSTRAAMSHMLERAEFFEGDEVFGVKRMWP